MSVLFDPETHTYKLNGCVLPSVTQIMEPMSLLLYRDVPPDVMAAAADRGTRAHEQVSNFVKYGLLETDDDTEGYLEAFQRFSDDYNPAWTESEYRLFHKTLLYAGTVDLLGYIEPDDGTGVDVVDIKCTRIFHSVMLETQVSGYEQAVKSHGILARSRRGLQLMQDGTYRFERLNDGFKTFLYCLGITRAMQTEARP